MTNAFFNLQEAFLVLCKNICPRVYSQDGTGACFLRKLIALLREDPAKLITYIYLCHKHIFAEVIEVLNGCKFYLKCIALPCPFPSSSPCQNDSGNRKYLIRSKHTIGIEDRQHVTELQENSWCWWLEADIFLWDIEEEASLPTGLHALKALKTRGNSKHCGGGGALVVDFHFTLLWHDFGRHPNHHRGGSRGLSR